MAIPQLEQFRDDLVGFQFPTGTLSVESYENWLACDAVLSVPLPPGTLHPAWILIGGFRGMGLSLTELFSLMRAAEDDGVMFGETSIVQNQVLKVACPYRVEGEITGVNRHRGARLGVFDVIAFTLRLIDESGAIAATAANSFVVPRR